MRKPHTRKTRRKLNRRKTNKSGGRLLVDRSNQWVVTQYGISGKYTSQEMYALKALGIHPKVREADGAVPREEQYITLPGLYNLWLKADEKYRFVNQSLDKAACNAKENIQKAIRHLDNAIFLRAKDMFDKGGQFYDKVYFRMGNSSLRNWILSNLDKYLSSLNTNNAVEEAAVVEEFKKQSFPPKLRDDVNQMITHHFYKHVLLCGKYRLETIRCSPESVSEDDTPVSKVSANLAKLKAATKLVASLARQRREEYEREKQFSEERASALLAWIQKLPAKQQGDYDLLREILTSE